ncbi:MAG TPA: hypothetical protein VI298_06530 [Geobacteraceae bacterium]
MADFSCIVVCEGSSDFSFIEGIIKHIGSLHNKVFEAILLAPEIDATSGKHQRFGYEGVKNWCKYQSSQFHNFGKNKVGSLLAWHDANLILIHLDADIADKIDINQAQFNGRVKDRRNWCSDALDNWFGVLKDNINYNYIIPTWQIETWLLATFDNITNPVESPVALTDYETILDVESKLLSLGYREDLEKPGRLYKEKNLFATNSKYVPRLLANLPTATSRCSELLNFENILSGYC